MLRTCLLLALAAMLLPPALAADTPSATGTGFVVNSAGYLLTCAHVVRNTARVKVLLGGKKYLATVVRTDEAHDLALVKIPVEGLTPLALSEVTTAEKGMAVRAFGYPLSDLIGEDLKVSGGMISGVVPAEHGDWWQIDAAVNPGNSGGPLTDRALQGQVMYF
jgi:serine protease Do